MNIGIILAGGTGTRMKNSDIPKQFMEVQGKPIIVHTIEVFQGCEEIDALVVCCVESWADYMRELVEKFDLSCVKAVIPGGASRQLSIFEGLKKAKELSGDSEDAIVINHDGVRPLITAQTLKDNIASVKKNGSAITCAYSKETIILIDQENNIVSVPERALAMVAKAPQSFYLKDLMAVHEQAMADGVCESIDSCTLMTQYGKKLSIINGPYENIKITTQDDYYTFSALCEAWNKYC